MCVEMAHRGSTKNCEEVYMSIRNRIYNWLHRVKHYNGKGCRNAAIVAYTKYGTVITKFDWSKPITFVSKEAAAWLRKESL